MRSHFSLPRGAAAACAMAGVSTMLNANCCAQSLIAADYATNSTYGAGWSAGQNGGYGFGAWSFNGTEQAPTNQQYQGISTSSPMGTAWTLLTHSSSNGLANAGRAIPGGLQPGQTFEAILQNPSTWQGIYTYRGFDLLFTSGPDNNVPGDNTSAIRLQVFDYFNPSQFWSLQDASFNARLNPLNGPTTAAAGAKLDLTLIATNSYSLTITPLSNPSAAYTRIGEITNSISWVDFRLWNGASGGLTDTANNFSISSMTIQGLTLNIQKAGANVLLSWPALFTNFSLVSSTNLSVPGWTAVSTNASGILNGQTVVTNPIAGSQQFYRLQLQQ